MTCPRPSATSSSGWSPDVIYDEPLPPPPQYLLAPPPPSYLPPPPPPPRYGMLPIPIPIPMPGWARQPRCERRSTGPCRPSNGPISSVG